MKCPALEIFDTQADFVQNAFKIFKFQYSQNKIYKRFCDALGVTEVESVSEIPLLPIKAFKEAIILSIEHPKTIQPKAENMDMKYFQSSGTSAMTRSKHFIFDPALYKRSVLKGMNHFYDFKEYVIWAFTPGYAENPHSSLIEMLKILIEADDSGNSRFLNINESLPRDEIDQIYSSGKKLMLFGAAFGLLDLLEKEKIQLPKDALIIETGGMKTHRREIDRLDLHQRLADGFGLSMQQIHSEYGMAELLSQAYSQGNHWFHCVPWMKISIRNPDDPLEELQYGEAGLIGIIDLANLYSCSFILTGDKGVQRDDGAFQVIGRWNPQDLRGCNFLLDRD